MRVVYMITVLVQHKLHRLTRIDSPVTSHATRTSTRVSAQSLAGSATYQSASLPDRVVPVCVLGYDLDAAMLDARFSFFLSLSLSLAASTSSFVLGPRDTLFMT
jgi:hypothetical protein